MVKIGNSWDGILKEEFEKDYYLRLREFLKKEYASCTVYPNMYDIFNAFKHTAYEDVKVVILGQDPYHEPGQAHGLCFSVKSGALPPSLVNIFSEICNEFDYIRPTVGDLTCWARQGVFLLNTLLTVREGQPMSHRGQGWETFTDAVIEKLNAREKPIVFMLWGRNARNKRALISDRHVVLETSHPSPLSSFMGFFGCGHFAKANVALEFLGQGPIDWHVIVAPN
ncbi:MAG: uracil-DNA glycosylase [Firmicutes bacterium]|nr:uracil-DNA glycosylase [Bacillota bacterium]